eukprot:TRINITY_DN30865_c0_g1_i1.p1 TRINITY_DN30865_c0_g1~~TRINITY_DN30865_c0_g1_i1.p1  ORF type:complete len:361 (-),score=62.79 TRINITY_DN30865_c0_g1_i1:421-1503(-)
MVEFVIDDRDDMGPRAVAYMMTCARQSPTFFLPAWISAAIFLVLTCSIAGTHICRLQRTPMTLQQQHYIDILRMPIVFGVCSLALLLCPRSYVLATTLELLYEAYTLSVFGSMLFTLLAYRCGDPDIGGDHGSVAQRIIAGLASQGPKKHFAVPPFGCCFRCCMKPHILTAHQAAWLPFLLRLYTRVAPISCIFSLWAALALDDEYYAKALSAACLALRVSALTSVYGLFILYNSSKELLKDWHTLEKFLSIKAILLLSVLQDRLVELLVGHGVFHIPACIRNDRLSDFMRIFINQWLLGFEMVFMALLLVRAFPPHELVEAKQEHWDYVELELARMSLAGNLEDGSITDEEDSITEVSD